MTITNRDIKQWEPLVNKIAGKYMGVFRDRTDIDYDDILQFGRIGLMRALENYKESNGSFINYASKAIARTILRGIDRTSSDDDNLELDCDIEDSKTIDKLDNRIDFQIALDNLKASDYIKSILKLRYNGFSCPDIAKMLGKSYQNIHGIITRYKDKLM